MNAEELATLPKAKWALVVTHMLNQNLVQGFPMYAESANAVRDLVEACLSAGRSVPIEDEAGVTQINLVLGGGMSYQIEAWEPFQQRMENMRKQQEAQMRAQQEAETAARLGVTLPNGPRRIR
jgi:hypothetical protein